MSNIDQRTDDEREERRQSLEQFARPEEEGFGNREMMVPAQAFSAGGDRIVGAHAVAVYRDEAKVLQKIRTLAAAAGSDWYYRFPVRGKDGTSYIEGPSIKLANDLARLYGNCVVDTRVLDLGDSWVFYARFMDIETGFELTRPYQQRKSQKVMKTDDDRARDIAFQIGASKAIRNVICNALQTFADFAFEEAKGAFVDKVGHNLEHYRQKVIERLEPLGLPRVERIMGRTADQWIATDIARIIAMIKAVEDGMATWDETFPQLPGETAQPESKLREFGAKKPKPDKDPEPKPDTSKEKPITKGKTATKPKGSPAGKAASPEPAKEEAAPTPAPEPEPAQEPAERETEVQEESGPGTFASLKAELEGITVYQTLVDTWEAKVEAHIEALGGSENPNSDYMRLAAIANDKSRALKRAEQAAKK